MLVGYSHLKRLNTPNVHFLYLFDLKRIITPKNKHLIWFLLHKLKFAFEKCPLPFSFNFPDMCFASILSQHWKDFNFKRCVTQNIKGDDLKLSGYDLRLLLWKLYTVRISPGCFVSFFSKRNFAFYKIKVQYNCISVTIHLIQNLCSEFEMNDFY